MTASNRSRITYPRPWKLRTACAALIIKWLAGLTGIVSLILGFSVDAQPWMLIALAAIGVFVVFAGVSFLLANELPCNVCRQPLLLAKRCRKHVNARKFVGVSYPLGIAIPALLTNRYYCMHCGEKIPLNDRRSGNVNPISSEDPGAASATTPASNPTPSATRVSESPTSSLPARR